MFGTTPQPPYGAFAVSQDLKLPYVINFNVNVQQQLAPTMIAQIGYVGTRGHRLGLMRDINAPAPRAGGVSQAARPYNAQYPTLAAINELDSIGSSEYNSLQMSLIQNSWHGVSGRLNYTLSHAMDNGSEARNTLPMNSAEHQHGLGERGVRHPSRHQRAASPTTCRRSGSGRLGDGWQFNVISTIQSGSPFNITTGADTDGTGDRQDRPNLVGDPFAGIVQPTTGTRRALLQPGGVRAAGRRHVRQPGAQRLLRAVVQDRRLLGVQDDEVERRRVGAAALRDVQPVQHDQLGEPGRVAGELDDPRG